MTSPMLSAIDAEVDRSEREAEIARRIRAFAVKQYEEPFDRPARAGADGAAQASGPPPVRRRGGAVPGTSGNPTLDEICDLVHREGPMRRGDVHARLGGNIKSIGRKLQQLERAGRIEAVGPPSRRAYRAPAGVRANGAAPAGAAKPAARRPLVPTRDDLGEIAATIAAQSGALDERRIGLATRIPAERVEAAVRVLLDCRAVTRTEQGTLAVVAR